MLLAPSWFMAFGRRPKVARSLGDIETVKIGCSIMSLKRLSGSAGVDFKLLYESEFYRHATHSVGGSVGVGILWQEINQCNSIL